MTTRITADLLIPGRGEPIRDGVVVMDGGEIGYAGDAAGAPETPDADVVHVPAVMPGMWECHGHFIGLTNPDFQVASFESTITQAGRATADLAATLDAGVTSVREVGGLGIHLRHAIAEGFISGPHIYSAGAVLSATAGHADIHGFPTDVVEQLAHHGDHLGFTCDGVAECLKAVRVQLRMGADVIKICASGGVMSEIDHPIHQQFSDAELRAIVEEAERAERIVAAHCHGKPGIMAALRAGVKTIEHGSYLDEEAAELMLEHDAILVPTRFILEQLLGMEAAIQPYAYRKAVMVADHHAMALKTAIAAGVKIAMGTDIFVSGPMYGRNSAEVALMINGGMTPLEAIEAATANGPDTLGPQAPRSGQLQSGYDADVIAFDTNPLEDMSVWGNAKRVTHVWKGGELVKQPPAV
ncbi:MAG: amidohydrolase family protein [Acidimicrobiia bacterium]|nr:amidohydrolase family protein [Acidimicrobiia bacterium]